MRKQYHILNGDHLKSIFPSELSGETYVLRECLVDGPVKADDNSTFYNLRATFISEEYKVIEPDQYFTSSVNEFEKISTIPEGSEVNLWFEEDLFCQVNFWFACSLLEKRGKSSSLFWVAPFEGSEYSFGNEGPLLLDMFQKRIEINSDHLSFFSQLWQKFQEGGAITIDDIPTPIIKTYPFLTTVLESLQTLRSGNLQRKVDLLFDDIKNRSFEEIFCEFTKRYPQFGFGDLQIKRLLHLL